MRLKGKKRCTEQFNERISTQTGKSSKSDLKWIYFMLPILYLFDLLCSRMPGNFTRVMKIYFKPHFLFNVI